MRAIFGLVSLLVVVGIMMLIFKSIEAPQLEVGKKAQDQAQQISGRDANGIPAKDSYTAESFPDNGPFRGIKIDTLTDGGAMQTYYGLKPGDVVMQINSNDVTALGGSYDMAKAELDEAFQNASPLTVIRDDNKMSLPVGGAKSPLDNLIH
jgi:C-terminal processing protease CtpA/Prc